MRDLICHLINLPEIELATATTMTLHYDDAVLRFEIAHLQSITLECCLPVSV